MTLAFTGTQKGMTQKQRETVRYLFNELLLTCLHHGDCIGADAQAHTIAHRMRARIESHPPIDEKSRAFCEVTIVHNALPFLKRNHVLVLMGTGGLVAAPRTHVEVLRSGTWATIRYARKLGRHIWIVWPSGDWKEENGN